MIRFVTPFALSALIALPAFAGAYQDAEAQLRKAYSDYRAALFLSNQGKQAETKAALDRFVGEWQTLSNEWTASPPPQYADDAVLGATFDKVGELAAKAKEEVATGKLPEAHETLEGVRESIGDLHLRNGVVGFSDRMNAYHAEMEKVLARDYVGMGGEGARQLIADASLLSYLAAQVVKHPAPEADADMSYQKLVDGFAVSVAFFYDAAMAGDMERAMEMRNALKASYAQLFAKFG